jgi:hypothetical protein
MTEFLMLIVECIFGAAYLIYSKVKLLFWNNRIWLD